MRTRGLVAFTVGLAAVATVLPTPFDDLLPAAVGTTGVALAAPGDTTRYVPLAVPTRLLDTRSQGGAVAGGAVVSLQVAGGPGQPSIATARAVVLNVTVVGPAAVGFWTVFPHGAPVPTASNVNIDERASLLGDALAQPNLVTVPVGADGYVDVFSQSGGHLVVDMLGAYELSGPSTSGRFVPLAAPRRALDTRDFLVLAPQSITEVRIAEAAGASAVVLNVTAIGSAAGYWTVYPTSSPTPPTAANLNSLGLGHVSANQVIVPVDADGDVDVFTQSGGHLVVDVVGTISGSSAASSSDGLFVPLSAPTRFLDTRVPSLNPLGGTQALLAGWNLEVGVAGNPAIGRPDVAALALNVTATESLAGGYVTVSPAGSTDPSQRSRATSTLNLTRAAQTLPNHATVAVSSRGFDVFTQSGAHVLADVSGFYLGNPVPAPFGVPSNSLPTVGTDCLASPGEAIGAIVTGSSPATVARAQQRLLSLGYWLSAADGSYGLTTRQATMAFQKWSGLTTSGNLDEPTAAALNRVQCRPTTGVTGDLFLVDKGVQLGMIVRGGRAEWVVNVSTGGDYPYTWRDKNGNLIPDQAITPSGTHKVYRVSDEPRYEGSLGTLYRPRFFIRGVAVHGYSSVPNYPASHGCVRVTNQAMDMLWATNAMPMGSTVLVRD